MTIPLGGEPASVGMSVVGSDGERIGQIADVREDAILVGRGFLPDLLVPVDAIDCCTGEVCRLRVPSHDVDEMADREWPTPGGASP